MANNAEDGILLQDYKFKTGTAGYTFLSNVLNFPGMMLDINSGLGKADAVCANYVLEYLYEIWQETSARNLFSNIPEVWENQTGEFAWIPYTNEYCHCEIQATDVGNPAKVTIGPKNIYDLGWLQWQYNWGGGPLHKIRFDDACFFPEKTQAYGVKIFLKPGVVATITLRSRPFPLDNMTVNTISG